MLKKIEGLANGNRIVYYMINIILYIVNHKKCYGENFYLKIGNMLIYKNTPEIL